MSSDPARPAGPTRPAAPTRGPVLRGRAVLLAAVAAVALTACGVRLETPPPPPPTPDAAETLRQRTVADALLLQELAAATGHPDPAVQLLLDAVEEAARAHEDALGGVYDPGTGAQDGAPDPAAGPPTPSPAAAPSPTDGPAAPEGDDTAGGQDAEPADDAAVGRLVATLAETAGTALAGADEAADGSVARLLGAVAVNRLLLGERLAAVAGVGDGAVGAGTSPWDDLDAIPVALPTDLPGSAALPLVTAEDLAGQSWEVVAARRDGDGRSAAADRAAAHRARAQAWAEATDVAGSGLDPRRTSYALPDGVLSGDAAQAASDLAALETRLADAYASLVAQAGPGARRHLVAASADAAGAAADLTGDVPAFPGMPELTG